MNDTGQCAVCGKHYGLAQKEHVGGRRPRYHFIDGHTRCPGCDLPALPRSRPLKSVRNRTRKVDQVFEAIKDYIESQGLPPSLRDIAEVAGISITTAHYYVKKLDEEGKIELRRGISRGIVIKEGATA